MASFEERFWAKVRKTESCWFWIGSIDVHGYGQIKKTSERRNVSAHRASYEMNVGTIPEGLTIDHLCRQRHCVRPDHLEVVTGAENTRRGFSPHATNSRKTHCVNGHIFDEENTVIEDGGRHCRKCRAEAQKRRLAKFRGAERLPRPTAEVLTELIRNGGTWTSIGLQYGVTDVAARKWAKKYGLIN